jgi:hypothetical protein
VRRLAASKQEKGSINLDQTKLYVEQAKSRHNMDNLCFAMLERLAKTKSSLESFKAFKEGSNPNLFKSSFMQKRHIARLVAGKGQPMGSFDPRNSPLPPANPFKLPTKLNNAAGL